MKERTTILYMWHMFQKYDCLAETTLLLPEDIGISSLPESNIRTVSEIPGTRRKPDDDGTTPVMRRKRSKQRDSPADSITTASVIQGQQGSIYDNFQELSKVLVAAISKPKEATDAAAPKPLTTTDMVTAESLLRTEVDRAMLTYVSMAEKAAATSNDTLKTIYNEQLKAAQVRLKEAEELYRQRKNPNDISSASTPFPASSNEDEEDN